MYNWNGEGYVESNEYKVPASFADALTLTVMATTTNGDETSNNDSNYTIDLEAVNFVWQGAAIN